jgi:hypothetical protein
MSIVMATLVSVQQFSIQMKKNILHASVNQVSNEMKAAIASNTVNLHVVIRLKFTSSLKMIATKRHIVIQATAHLLCQSIPHGHVPVNQEHLDTKENVAQNVQHSVVLTKIRLIFTVRVMKDIAVIKDPDVAVAQE